MRALRPLAVLLLAVLVSGCFQVKTLVKLNADGSGTVEETVLMNSTMAMAIMAGQEGLFDMDEDAEETPEADLPDGPYSIEALEARAEEMGARFVRVDPAEILFGGGYTAIYAFDDVNDLAVSVDPSDLFPGDMMGGGRNMEFDEDGELVEAEPEAGEPPVTFVYEGGQLTVRMPQAEPEAPQGDPKKQPEATDEPVEMPTGRELQQMNMVLRDMRFSFAVEGPGEIAETTADHVSGRTLTLFDIAFGELFSTPEAFQLMEEMDAAGGPDFGADARARFAQIPGVVYEDDEEVTVTFR